MTHPAAPPAPEKAARPTAFVPIDQALIRDVRVEVEARLGSTHMSVEALMALKPGSVVTLDTGLAEHVDIYLNDARVARGEIVAVGDRFGVRITELAADR
jgi:flagellar motor switch protein FliN/FliY